MQILSLLPVQYRISTNNRITNDNTVNPRGLSFKSVGDVFVKNSETIIKDSAKSDLIQKIILIFKNPADNAPKGLDIKISPALNQVLTFSKDLKGGRKLTATKQFIRKNGKNFFYISLKEYKNNELYNAFGIDMDTLDIVKLRQKGNIKFKDEDFIRVTPDNPQYNEYSKKLSEYVSAIFSGRKNSSVSTLTTKQKQAPQKNLLRITIDDLLDEDKVLYVPEEISPQEFAMAEKETEKRTETTVKTNLHTGKKHQKEKQVSKKTRPPKPENKKTTKVNNQIDMKAAQAARHTISKTSYEELSSDLSDKLLVIEDTLTKIAILLNDHRGNIGKIKYLKSNYKPLEYSANRQKTIKFKLTDNNILGVIHTKIGERFTRIIFKDSAGNETHFLIEDRKRIVSNLNKKKPWIVPMKFRYMTEEQINASNIDKYIEFLYKEVPRYHTYLKANL